MSCHLISISQYICDADRFCPVDSAFTPAHRQTWTFLPRFTVRTPLRVSKSSSRAHPISGARIKYPLAKLLHDRRVTMTWELSAVTQRLQLVASLPVLAQACLNLFWSRSAWLTDSSFLRLDRPLAYSPFVSPPKLEPPAYYPCIPRPAARRPTH